MGKPFVDIESIKTPTMSDVGPRETCLVNVFGECPEWENTRDPFIGERVRDHMRQTTWQFIGWGWVEYSMEASRMWSEIHPIPPKGTTVLYTLYHCLNCWNPNRYDALRDQDETETFSIIVKNGRDPAWPKPARRELFCSDACFVVWEQLPEEKKWPSAT